MNKLKISGVALALSIMAGCASSNAVDPETTRSTEMNMNKPNILTEAPNIPAGVIPDEVNLSNTVNLEELEVQYTYSSGRAYKLKFYDDRVSFTQLDAGHIPTLTVSYRARKIGKDMFLVHWLVPGRVGHVTLILDLGNKVIHASALMPGQMELFDEGPIVDVKQGKYTQ
ncbi:MAG: MoaF N-terminal domain-containing protein [Gammaproteobacteria bacterium]|nr:MoaF N-terminal domain-containing protein [Gammaproteobacteria bacterium]MBU1467414.1 MoaF N-terminal domain-containing protein [Gammaproteobacteria bacterium]MBU2024075.1 MoaF N-terminal domain-containing protein [Gammaproteobacteria bacterium]MBU2238363.1 MoaF N-terminal domain-containing protein [Gammaproteobacteria bacterium]MBU2319119.1 MoaF N-terminal domain-containing protein [Gammaproteobacteria bacterium]